MNYKDIIRNQDFRFKILHFFRFIPDWLMVKIQYRIKLGRMPNLKNPRRYTEKLQCYKLNYKNELITQCADKFEVRKYIEDKGLSFILNKLYKVYNSVEEINFEELPNEFVIKTTNGSGTNILCKNKEDISPELVKKTFENWMKRDYFSAGREWGYKNVIPRIIVEEYLKDNNNKFEGINDYKFLCFNGKVEYIVFDVDRHSHHKRNIYDENWNFVNVSTDHENICDSIPKPEGLEKMKEIAQILSKDFPCVRVDLYWVNNKVYFGELTFYPWTGYVKFMPDNFDYILGNKFDYIGINNYEK